MREDLILRYLRTSVERLELTRRHLEGELKQEDKVQQEDNRIAKEWHPDFTIDFFVLVQSYLGNIQINLELIEKVIDKLKEE